MIVILSHILGLKVPVFTVRYLYPTVGHFLVSCHFY